MPQRAFICMMSRLLQPAGCMQLLLLAYFAGCCCVWYCCISAAAG
jgi:hypothetical protein